MKKTVPPRSLKTLSRENNFFYLCFALLGLLASSALARQLSGTWGQELFTAVIVLLLFLGTRSLDPSRTLRRTIHGTLLTLLLLGLVSRSKDSRPFDYLSLALMTLYFLVALRLTARQILFVGRVDANKIVGSLSLYLLLGLIWTMFYLALLTLDPASLQGVEFTNWRASFPRVAYYSFVTLTTLGYGDILPANHLAEFFAYTEAIAGVFYMAIVVASLVSIGLAHLATGPKEGD